MRVLLHTLLFIFIGMTMQGQDIQLQLFADGFFAPVDIANAGDDRIFIVERQGTVRIVMGDGQVLPNAFMNITDRVRSGGERGLLGLAFHPAYPDTPHVYVNYTNNAGDTHLSRFTVSADSNDIDESSEIVLLVVDQPFGNHNGGDVAFGHDGYLYTGLGDGGSANDPGNRAQNRLTLLGKMLRIDVDNGDPYSIPDDNPFAEDDFTLDEIWAIGLRNPWRFSFDALTGDMYIADVGQGEWEEIDFQPASSPGGENYGWRCFEGNDEFVFGGNCDPNMTFPVHQYSHDDGSCSVTGGFVYRGSEYPSLYGKYIYGDYCTGICWGLYREDTTWMNDPLFTVNQFELSTFGEGSDGALYLAYLEAGRIYKLTDDCVDNPLASPTLEFTDGVVSVDGDFADVTWYRDGIDLDSTGNMITPLVDGLYWVDVIDARGCMATSDTLDVLVSDVNDIDAHADVIRPNPFKEHIELSLDSPEKVQSISIVNSMGITIYRASDFKGEYFRISTTDWPSGTYVLNIERKGGLNSQHVLIKAD